MNIDIEEMEDGKSKELLKILKEDGKPFVKKSDGHAVKVSEDKEITYKDYDELEKTLKVPAGSYVMLREGSTCPDIVTGEDFESKNKFIDSEPKKKEKKDRPKTGLDLID